MSVPAKAVAGEKVNVKVTVTNSGKVAGDEVVELYLTDEKASTPRPVRQLEGFKRIMLKPGESRDVEFTLEPRQFSIINKKDKELLNPVTLLSRSEENNRVSKDILILSPRRYLPAG